jgi:hypothetical protein
MATVEENLITLIKTSPDIIALVGDRIKPVELPLNCPLPAITYTVISDPNHQVAGYPRIQLSVYSFSYGEMKAISDFLRDKLKGYTGIIDGMHIIRISPENSNDISNDAAGVFGRANDYKIIYRREA